MKSLEIQGHRGCRGLMPENTIQGFVQAIILGVHTLEMDAVISGDHDVIISHEPYFNHEISTDPNGDSITESNEKQHNIYQLNTSVLQQYDVGLKRHPRFPDQLKVSATKPTLDEVVNAVNRYCNINNIDPPYYNIEIKRTPEHDEVYHPEYRVFADLVVQKIRSLGIAERTTVQCFDIETLQYIHKAYPEVPLVFLVENIFPTSYNLDKLGFVPTIYSPNYNLLTTHMIQQCHDKGIKVIPWTINEVPDMKAAIELGVDGIITDYPNRLVDLVKTK